MDILKMFNSKNTFERKVLDGPSSRRHVPKDMTLLDNYLNVSTNDIETGTEYATEYIQKEKDEFLQCGHYPNTNNENKFEAISVGSVICEDVQGTNNEETMKIYHTYNFAQHTKQELVVFSKRDEIMSMIETNSVVIIQGPTGCGKTTQVPQFILDSCYKKKLHCNIIVTQPRRIAAISIAKRVCQERNWPLGTLVGYQVGLLNHTSNDTRLTYCTTGILLHKLINVKNMLDYTHIILDEVHERDQDMDFLLLLVRKLLQTNSRSVKIMLMSATFEVDKYANYFSSPVRDKLVPAPIVNIPKKRLYNVGVYYLCQMSALGLLPDVSAPEPNVTRKMLEFSINLIKVLDDIDLKADDANYDKETHFYNRHVILVFLPGINEIEEMHDLMSLPKHEKSKWDIVILHSCITNDEQQQIFRKPPLGHRRVILSTNIAESSITVPDVKYVIDFCLTKQLVIDPKTNFQSLELKWASKVSCEQRAGRTGRVMDGRVYRLVPQTFYENVLPQEIPPEMLRAPLENVVLKTKLLSMGEPKAILALSLDPPDLGKIRKTILLLKEIGALIDKPNEIQKFDGHLSDLGRVMANLPLNVHASKLIMLGHVFGVLKDAIIVAATLSVKDMFNNPFQKKLLAYSLRLYWADKSYSDCIAFMNVYKVWITEKANCRLRNDTEEKEWATRHFVQIKVLREVKALVTELTGRLEQLGIRETGGVNKVVWKNEECPFVLKLIIAGAFYPNYFIRNVSDQHFNEYTGVKLLGGLDPANTVYLQGWPLRQPGPLYARKIQEIFEKNFMTSTQKIKVSFDVSSRVYVQFLRDSHEQQSSTARRICPLVYKAIKMRQCNIPIEIPILNEEIAMQRAEEMNLNKKPFYSCQSLLSDSIRPQLPGLREFCIPLMIPYVKNPGCFWIQTCTAIVKKRIHVIESTIKNIMQCPTEFTTVPKIGTLVIAPYEQNDCKAYFRAVVEGHVSSPEVLVQLFFIDYGYSSECRLCDIISLPCNSDVLNIPALAIQCKLANIGPSLTHSFNYEWSQAACDLFWTLINKPGQLLGQVYSVVNSIVAIELVHKIEEEEININKCLIEKRYVSKKQEDYFSRFNHDLRMKESDLTDEQCHHYETLQYNEDYMADIYPDALSHFECYKTLTLRGPFSPLEMQLNHLTIAGRDKKVNMAINSVNSVLLDTDPGDSTQQLLVAASVNQSTYGHRLTLYNTTLMPRLRGLTALTVLIFTPYMELRRNSVGTYYTGALCGLGFDPVTKKSLYPEHDIELDFDAEITLQDLQFINELRHWMNVGMQINHRYGSSDNTEEIIICQIRIRDALLKLMEKDRKSQSSELIANFDKWNLYNEDLFRQPGKVSILSNNIYRLHNALELEETTESHNMAEHIKNLRALVTEDPRNYENMDINCKLCKITFNSIFELRNHLYTVRHREKEKILGMKL